MQLLWLRVGDACGLLSFLLLHIQAAFIRTEFRELLVLGIGSQLPLIQHVMAGCVTSGVVVAGGYFRSLAAPCCLMKTDMQMTL